MTSPAHQRGVALIIALVLVALAAVLATKLTFDGFLERQRATGVLAVEQALEFEKGAEALAADVLLQDAQASGTGKQTTLAGIWAQPTPPFPITPQNNPEGEPIGTLQGQLEDMSGRFNLNTLARLKDDKTPDPLPLQQFQRLLNLVNLEPRWAALARDWIDPDDQASPDGGEDQVYTSQTPPYRTGNWPMMSASELMNLPGFGADRYRKIAPYVTALPSARTTINICTAPAPVLESLADNLRGEYSSPQVLTNARKTGCFPDDASFMKILGAQAAALRPWITTNSPYFRLTTRVTLGTTEITLYSLLYRSGTKVIPLTRSIGTP